MPPQMGSHLGGPWQGMPWQGLPQLQMDPQARQWSGLPPIDPSQHIAMQSPGGGGGGGGFSGFGGHHPNSYNPGGHISGGIASGSYNMPNDARPPIPPGYPASQADGPVQAQGKAWYGPTPPQTAPGSPPPLPQSITRPPSVPNLATPGYSFGATPGMIGTSADAWNQSDKPHVSEGYGPSAHAWTPRAAMGGHFMPGQSAIVGDRPNGKPGPNAEVVTAMPGGGFVVTPNSKNMPPMPRFADGSGGVFGGDTFGVPSPLNNHTGSPFINGVNNVANTIALPFSAHYAVGQELAADSSYANTPPPSFAVPHPGPNKSYLDSQRSMVAPPISVPHWLAHPIDTISDMAENSQGAKEFGEFLNSPWFEENRRRAQRNIDFVTKHGVAPDQFQPTPPPTSPSPVGKILGPPPLDPAVAPFMKGAMGYHPDLGPTAFGSPPPHDALPAPATPEPAWNANQLNAYALRQQTNDRLGLKQGDADWIDPNEAAKQMGATPQPEGPMMAAVDPAARANSILQGWQAAKMPEGPPPGLSPIAGRAWQEQRARMANTREGRGQILNTELARLGVDRQFGREVALHDRESQNTYFNQQALQTRKDTRGEAMAKRHQELVQQQEEARRKPVFIPKPLPGSNTATIVGGKVIPEGKAPPIPAHLAPMENAPGLYTMHDGSGKTQVMKLDENGNPVRWDYVPKAAAPAKEEKFNAYQTDPNGKVTYLHHPPGHKPPPGVTLLEPDAQAAPKIKSLKQIP